MSAKNDPLPLLWKTPPQWAAGVLRDVPALLNDHAHLEKKAAVNALELLARWPKEQPPERWVEALTAVARDETEHLALVTRLLAKFGGQFSKGHKNPYANHLRQLVRLGDGTRELADRLLVSALIEARSCERFLLLSQSLANHPTPALAPPSPLSRLYTGLWASEHGHYRTFITLAQMVQDPPTVTHRWQQMLQAESQIIQQQVSGVGMHSGIYKG